MRTKRLLDVEGAIEKTEKALRVIVVDVQKDGTLTHEGKVITEKELKRYDLVIRVETSGEAEP